MKKVTTLLVFLLLSSLFVNAQRAQVPRNMVVVEIGTGTWCQYCPGAAMGADDLVENGHNVAVIEYHNGDIFVNDASNARNTYYATTGYPTAHFDGGLAVVGGSHTQSMYGSYLPKVQQRNSILSSLTIDMGYTHTGSEYIVNVTLTKVAPLTSDNLKAHVVLTESEIMYNWQGQSKLDFVERKMFPDHNGTDIDFTSQDQIVLSFPFTLESSWVAMNCELVAFVQDNTTKEILQGAKQTMAQPEFNYDVELMRVEGPSGNVCGNTTSPVVTIKNFGGINLNSLEINYSINGGAPVSTQWSGDLGFRQVEQVELNTSTFNLYPEGNVINVSISNPNGQPDQNTSNDDTSSTFAVKYATERIFMEYRTDAYPDESLWHLEDATGNILASGGPYPNPNTVYKDTFDLTPACYKYVSEDSYGDGGAKTTLKNSIGQLIYANYGSFGSLDIVPLSVEPALILNSSPADTEANIAIDANIVFTFNQPMRKYDNTSITNDNVASLFQLKTYAGIVVPFTATINLEKTQITIDPTNVLDIETMYRVSIATNVIETYSAMPVAATTITFMTIDVTAPVVTFTPSNATTGVPINSIVTVSFDELIRNIDNSEITNDNLAALIGFKEGEVTGTDVSFSATINFDKNLVTITPTNILSQGTNYFVSIQAVENFSDLTTGVQNLTFTTGVYAAPTVIITPANGSTNIALKPSIVFNFSEAVRNLDNSELNPMTISNVITFKENDANGNTVIFSAIISTDKTQITITPVYNLLELQNYFVEVKNVENQYEVPLAAQSIVFTTLDATAPTATFNPANGATDVANDADLVISLSEAIRNTNDSEITNDNVNSVIVFKKDNATGEDVPFVATINSEKTEITVNPASNLTSLQDFYLAVVNVEDMGGNALAAVSVTFKTAEASGISNFESLNTVKISPNPVSEQAKLKFTSGKASQVTIQIYNQLGNVVFTAAKMSVAGENNMLINCANLENGIYLVKVTSDSQSIATKMVVKK